MNNFLNTPLALYPPAVRELLLRVVEEQAEAVIPVTSHNNEKPYDMIDGVAVIPISGVLVHGDAWWGEMSYDDISLMLSQALNDPDAKAIALQIASPGGDVAGLFDLADSIYSVRGKKPLWAILDDYAYSAAYAIASATDRIFVPRVGGVGSVGVVAVHLDLSGMLEQYGIKANVVQYGARKTDFSPFKPLSDDAKKLLQMEVNTLGEMFVEMVGRNRKLASSKVRDTEAGVFMGQAGVDTGFADEVATPPDALRALMAMVA